MSRYDVAIVGAGLVGASLACAIAASESCKDLRIALIEPGPAPRLYEGDEFDPRVVALTRQSQQFLAGLAVWPDIQQRRLCPYTRMFVWDGEGNAAIEFDSREIREENLGHIVENSVVLDALLTRLDGVSQVQLLRGSRVQSLREGMTGNGGTSNGGTDNRGTGNRGRMKELVLDNGEVLAAKLILAADGGNSKLRQLAAMNTREWDYGQDAIVATVRSEKSHDFTARQRFMHTGPLAFLPLCTRSGDSHFSSIVWSADRALATELMAMDDQQFAQALGAAFERCLGDIVRVDRRYSFPLRQRHAVNYVRPGLALLGDAAHTIHPLAGQGVNLGLADAQVLVAEIRRAMARDLPLSDYSVLRRYARQRKGANLAMMSLMEGFKRLFGSRHPGLQLLRNMGMRQVDSLPYLKNLLAREAMGLQDRL